MPIAENVVLGGAQWHGWECVTLLQFGIEFGNGVGGGGAGFLVFACGFAQGGEIEYGNVFHNV